MWVCVNVSVCMCVSECLRVRLCVCFCVCLCLCVCFCVSECECVWVRVCVLPQQQWVQGRSSPPHRRSMRSSVSGPGSAEPEGGLHCGETPNTWLIDRQTYAHLHSNTHTQQIEIKEQLSCHVCSSDRIWIHLFLLFLIQYFLTDFFNSPDFIWIVLIWRVAWAQCCDPDDQWRKARRWRCDPECSWNEPPEKQAARLRVALTYTLPCCWGPIRILWWLLHRHRHLPHQLLPLSFSPLLHLGRAAQTLQFTSFIKKNKNKTKTLFLVSRESRQHQWMCSELVLPFTPFKENTCKITASRCRN